jgi:hypothetical protein
MKRLTISWLCLMGAALLAQPTLPKPGPNSTKPPLWI